eukprot:Gb_37240 [translate_table: standard]
MELAEHEGGMGGLPLPILVSTYAPTSNIHESSSKLIKTQLSGDNGTVTSDENRTSDQQPAAKKSIRYRECLKNHAASIGGHAIDGCGDFMPSGEDGTLEALKCAACNCHRNFHRREVEGEPPCYYCYNPRKDSRKLRSGGPPPLMGPQMQNAMPPLQALPSSTQMQVQMPRLSPQMIMALSSNNEENNYINSYGSSGGTHVTSGGMMPMIKKRFRTKFSNEQKEKMYAFAEKIGWRIQKHDEAAVQQFCMDVGVKRHVLKVWMHNNKSHLLSKTTPATTATTP